MSRLGLRAWRAGRAVALLGTVVAVLIGTGTGAGSGAGAATGGGPGRSVSADIASARSAETARTARTARAADALAWGDPAGLVDPFVGTGNGGRWVGRVDTFPGPSLPFGMLQWSPDTTSRPDGGGYAYADSALTGFSLTHLSGPGCRVAGDVPFLPLAAGETGRSVPFSHDGEVARPGYYAVTAGGVRTELSTTLRTGVADFTFPPDGPATGTLLVRAERSQTATTDTSVSVLGDREIVGQVSSGRFCSSHNHYTLYFAARFDRPFTIAQVWAADAHGSAPGATLGFDLGPDHRLGAQVAVSYVDPAGAEANLAAEGQSWNVGQVAARAYDVWSRQLGSITVAGGSQEQRAIFYTALYHSLLHPSVFSDADGRYRGFDDQVHRIVPGHPHYADFSGWDIYRCQVPLVALIAPGSADDMATSLLDDADQSGGWLPKWPVAAGDTDVMNGDPADPILADVYAFGDHGFDVARALRLAVHGAEDSPSETDPPAQGWYVERPWLAEYLSHGYVPNAHHDSTAHVNNGASETLEYGVADFAVSRLAAALGQDDVASRFRARSHGWQHLFDPATGYLRPREADGTFPPGPPGAVRDGSDQDGFQEGNAAQYTWMVPQDLPALVSTLGGPDAVNPRLDRFFTELNAGPGAPYDWQGNEPSFDVPWLYDSTGRPDRTEAVVRSIVDQLYGLSPGGEPGNDDLGAMSSWYVWAALGLYPETPGTPVLALGSPLFPYAAVHRPSGHDLTITAAGTGPYVRALLRDGVPSSATWVDGTDGTASRLAFYLSPTPTTWGTASSDAPPAFP
ncbi:GH92 family glycosyl hydrolase [Streptacidiphilus fuscans]|uniref:GH92 family glycosyl hydrolase n=1 Tax=Streptacidiphilus fuscans TaxID=2789292 RepID=A0A931B3H7_9ACTN|nr:GH92 family glycosyl hydrolase [Streptacidiphilus fuscans]MBF9068296.1 GH92 family glycosyl hydrolase [Streptacidiphilus fuscans]